VIATARAVITNRGLSINKRNRYRCVYLKWATGSEHERLILKLADASDAAVDTHVEMNWVGLNHLELT